jgi:hypothetical protein
MDVMFSGRIEPMIEKPDAASRIASQIVKVSQAVTEVSNCKTNIQMATSFGEPKDVMKMEAALAEAEADLVKQTGALELLLHGVPVGENEVAGERERRSGLSIEAADILRPIIRGASMDIIGQTGRLRAQGRLDIAMEVDEAFAELMRNSPKISDLLG